MPHIETPHRQEAMGLLTFSALCFLFRPLGNGPPATADGSDNSLLVTDGSRSIWAKATLILIRVEEGNHHLRGNEVAVELVKFT